MQEAPGISAEGVLRNTPSIVQARIMLDSPSNNRPPPATPHLCAGSGSTRPTAS